MSLLGALREGATRGWLWLLILASSAAAEMPSSYANVTLTSMRGDLSVVVFLPNGLKPDESTFYSASRFDHGSMIGSITRNVRTADSHGKGEVETHVLFETDMWRAPHNSHWPESGVGLASEFGVGDDGAFCYYRCGWSGASDVTNGVLGYQEAKNGESFLKIGVGELVKGTCPICDSTEDYRFNSPYIFARPPEWKILEISDHSISLEHEAHLGIFGYKLQKDISLDNDVLSVTTSLTNMGQNPFSTAWYSHNFFSCDGKAVGPGYSLDLGLKGDTNPLYDEPGTWSWSTPLRDYAKIKRKHDSVEIEMERALNSGVRIKTEFVNDKTTTGAFRLQACGTSIASDLSSFGNDDKLSMYSYNLYVERGTFSPEPAILIYLNPWATASWTQRLVIGDSDIPEVDETIVLLSSFTFISSSFQGSDSNVGYFLLLVTTTALVLWSRSARLRRQRGTSHQYTAIPDLQQ